MSSDNDQIPQSGKRRKLVIHDSNDSDESIVQSRRRKKTSVCIISFNTYINNFELNFVINHSSYICRKLLVKVKLAMRTVIFKDPLFEDRAM